MGRGLARAESARFARQHRFLLCDISSAPTALTALTNVCIDNYGVRHSCFGLEACVVRDLAVPYKAGRICEAQGTPTGGPGPPAEESLYAVEESRRRAMGPGSQGAVGRRSAIGRAEASRSGGPSAARP